MTRSAPSTTPWTTWAPPCCAVVVNRLPAAGAQTSCSPTWTSLPVPVYAIPEVPELSAPTVAEVAAALHATRLVGDDAALDRDVRDSSWWARTCRPSWTT